MGHDGFKQCSYDRVVIECPKTKKLDVEDRYREVGPSSRKTMTNLMNHFGHRTI